MVYAYPRSEELLWTGDIKYYDWRVGRRIGIVGIFGRDLGGFV